MSDNLNQQIIDLQKELAETKAANQSLKEEVSNSKSAEFETTIKELTASLAAKTEEVLQLTEAAKYSKEDMEKKKEEMTAMQKKMKDMEEELAVMKKKEAMMKRKAELVDAGLDADSATSTAEDFSDADDEVFGRVLAAIKKSLSISAASVNEEPKAEEVKELDEEVDSSEANESDLDSVEETKEVTIAEVTVEDETESLRAVASEWLGSVLRSTPKNK